jgi:hypothetical protein
MPRKKATPALMQPADVAPRPTIDKTRAYDTPRARWDVPTLVQALALPPERLRRTLGGLAIKVRNRAGGAVHRVLVAEAGNMTAEFSVRVGGSSWRLRYEDRTKTIRVSQAAHCLTCDSMDCLGCQYGLAILASYLYEPFGFKDTSYAEIEAQKEPAGKDASDASPDSQGATADRTS